MSGGGHWLDTDTGPGPVLLDPAEEPAERAHEVAWREYRRHLAGCTQCQAQVRPCPAGDALRTAYSEAPR